MEKPSAASAPKQPISPPLRFTGEAELRERRRRLLHRQSLVQALLPPPPLALPATLSTPVLPPPAAEVIEASLEEIVRSKDDREEQLDRTLAELDALEREVAEKMAELEAARTAKKPAPRPDAHSTRRVKPRHSVVVSVDLASDNNFYGGFGLNISEGGVFVATAWVLPLGSDIDLEIQLPENERISARGQVAWHRKKNASSPDAPPGMGIRFVEVDRRDLLLRFIQTRSPL